MGIFTRVDERSDLVVAHNRLIDRDAGNSAESATQIRWTRYDGVERDPRTGAALSSGNHTLKIRSTVGKHRATLLAATSATATPSAANSVVLEEDDGLFIGAGKALRLYDAAGTDYSQLTSDADGGLVVGGSGASAGDLSMADLTLAGNLTFTGARRILADFTNATVLSRTLFQTSTVNGITAVDAIPNGTGAGAAFEVYSTSNPAASARLILYAGATEHYLLSDHAGAAYLPLLIMVGGAEAARFATTGLFTANLGINNAGPWLLSSQITPAALAANTDNYAPAGIDTASVLNISASAPVNLTGLQLTSYVGQTGRMFLLINVGGNAITLKHEVTSTAANRFNTHTSGDFVLGGGEAVFVIYTATGRWRTIGFAA